MTKIRRNLTFYLKYAFREFKNRISLKKQFEYIKPTKVLINHSSYPEGWFIDTHKTVLAPLGVRYNMIGNQMLKNKMILLKF